MSNVTFNLRWHRVLNLFFDRGNCHASDSRKGDEHGIWFVYTLVAIIIPFTSSKTSNLLRCLQTLFGFAGIRKKRYYTFIASPKIPWKRLWQALWKMIPCPETDGRLLLALDEYINPKTRKKIFGCDKVFDHTAKLNQSPPVSE